jgi:UDP-MurNAc hydroxylase
MKVAFIGQASVVITTEDCSILCDPWLIGTAFNDSWRHFPKPAFDASYYHTLTHVWISHEHPDHFHIPTIKQMPADFKARVTLLYQKNNSDKMPKALASLGFKNIVLLPNRKQVAITPKTVVYNHQVGQMDSALAVVSGGKTVLNMNDCEANNSDCKRFRADLGAVEVVLNQFSMAGYNGEIDYAEVLPGVAQHILVNMQENHRDLGAQVTIPFASNVYFCCADNRHINQFGNSPVSAHAEFQKAGLHMEVLYPGDVYDLETKTADTARALDRYTTLYAGRERMEYATGPVIELEEIEKAFVKRAQQLAEKYPSWIMNKLGLIRVQIPDVGATIEISLGQGTFEVVGGMEADFDLIVHSQPLYFAFAVPFGLQTLGVSARWLIKSKQGVWRWYRIVTSLNNAEIWLKPRYLFTKTNLDFVRARLDGGLNQLRYQLQRME